MTQDTKTTKGRTACQDPNKTDKAGRTKIFTSTSSGNLQRVQELIAKGADVNHRDHAGWVPLHVAALKGQYEIAKCLIEHGAIVNVRGFEDATPLHDACSFGYSDCVKLFIDAGADVFALNTDKKRPIDLCEDGDCIAILNKKMEELDSLSSKDHLGRTSLHRTCLQDECPTLLDDLLSLLNKGMNTNSKDNHQQTPLHCAVQKGHLNIVKALIDHGADINSVDNTNSTPLHIACQNSFQFIVEYLVNQGADVHVVNHHGKTASQVTDCGKIKQLITDRIEEERRLRATTEAIDEVTFVSQTRRKVINNTLSEDTELLSREERKIQAIMRSFENAEKKKRVSKKGDGVNNNNNNTKKRKSPSKQSRESSIDEDNNHKRKKVVDVNKLDPFKKDTSGRTQLHKWSSRGHMEAVETLLKAGANPCEKDNAGYTPLHEAALNGQLNAVEYLLMHGADVNCKGAELDTPLHDAAENGYTDIVQVLLDYGADTQARNSNGLTALDIAIEDKNTEIENIIRNHKGSCPPDIKAKAHARQLSGQHLPKKSLKPHSYVKTEIPPDGPHTPIPTPPPENWQQKVIKKEEDFNNGGLYPSVHYASRYLPLYTIQLSNNNNSHFYVIDLQVSLMLNITTYQLKHQYPLLYRQLVSQKEKEKLWSPLSAMICSTSPPHEKKQQFMDTDVYFMRLDQIVTIIKEDYNHLSESLITITLDIGYSSKEEKQTTAIKLPPKFAMKMRKLLK